MTLRCKRTWTSVLALLGACTAADRTSHPFTWSEGEVPTGDTAWDHAAQPPSGLRLQRLSVNQGLEVPLVVDGAPPDPPGVAVEGRPGLLRAFVAPEEGFDPRWITGRLTVTSPAQGERELRDRIWVSGASLDGELGTTLNFELLADELGPETVLTVELVEGEEAGPGGGDPEATAWSGGVPTAPTAELVVEIVPIRYLFDGSGRLPDTRPDQLELLRHHLTALFPARSVTLRVQPPFDWAERIAPDEGEGWISLLTEMTEQRGAADESPNTYYHAMFAPEPTFAEFCSGGCYAGLSFVARTAGDPSLRASVGLGYPGQVSADTLVHELGHTHGRLHAPCGLGGQSSDPAWPGEDASIGAWGYDIVEGRLHGPERSLDFMSYCSPIWVSPYTWDGLSQRLVVVEGQGEARGRPRPAFVLGADGRLSRRGTLPWSGGGESVDVEVLGDDGRPIDVIPGELVRFDHLPGGLLVLAREPGGPIRVRGS